MTNSKDDSGKDHESIFEILDGMMSQLSQTKTIFMIMILTTLIIPPTALLIMTAVFDSPFNEKLDERLLTHLEAGNISEEDYKNFKEKIIDSEREELFLKPPQLIIFIISLAWLGIGISQWIRISKWDKKYQRFKEKQADIDKELSDNPDDKNS